MRHRTMTMLRMPANVASLPALAALALAAVLLAAAPAMAQKNGPGSFADLADRLSPAVVNISTSQTVTVRQRSPFPPGSPFEEFFDEFFGRRAPDGEQQAQPQRRLQSLGSGFIIDPSGLIVTNNHVVNEADEITVRTIGGTEYEAEVIGTDAEIDVALLRIEADTPLPALEWGDSDAMRVGDWVLAIGNPFALGGTVTAGIVSAHHRNISNSPWDDFIQTDASINRGNSGGPLFDMEGKVVGINSAIFSPTGGNVGIGFAIPSNLAARVIAQIQEYGYARRGFLGVSIQPVDKMTAEALGLGEAQGALVASVTPGSPAEKAGIQPYDIIIEFAGETIKDSDDLVKAVGNTDVGEKAQIILLRNGERRKVAVVTTEKPRPEDAASPAPAPSRDDSLGASFSDLTPLQRQQFDIPADVSGVLVLNPGSRLAGRLNRGDVVTEVSREPVANVAELTGRVAALREEGRNNALFRVFRGGQYFFIPIPLQGEGG